MSESGMSLVEAKRELEKRQNEVTRCIAELEAAQSGALAEAPRILRVSIDMTMRGLQLQPQEF